MEINLVMIPTGDRYDDLKGKFKLRYDIGELLEKGNPDRIKKIMECAKNATVILSDVVYDKMIPPLEYDFPCKVYVITEGKIRTEGNVESFSTLDEALKMVSTDKAYIIADQKMCKECFDNDIPDNIYGILSTEYTVDVAHEDTFTFPIPEKLACGTSNTPSKYFRWSNGYNEFNDVSNLEIARFPYVIYREFNVADYQYKHLVTNILMDGSMKDTRAGKTRSLFAQSLRFNISKRAPILTTKKMFMKGCIHELLWFISGDTNIKYLVDNGVHIWDDDAYRHYLNLVDRHNKNTQEEPEKKWFCREALNKVSKEEFMEGVKRGDQIHIVFDKHAYLMSYQPNAFEFTYTFGDLGPVYGHQWNKWYPLEDNGDGYYRGGKGQLETIIETLKTNPDDRRMLISSWNVTDLHEMALPPCHYSCQFYSTPMSEEKRIERFMDMLDDNKKAKFMDLSTEEIRTRMDEQGFPTRTLSLLWNQRSVDVGLGLPFNIMSYALLVYMVAQCVNMLPEELVFFGGDCHIYVNQIEQLKEQMGRRVSRYPSPVIRLNPEIKNIKEFKYEDIKIEEYRSYPTVKMPLSTGL